MSPARDLYELQQIDMEVRGRQQALSSVRARLADQGELERARARVQEAEKQLADLRREQRDLELEVEGLQGKIRQLEGKLYGGSITNPKELLGLQQEIKHLQQAHREREDRLLEVMVQVEDASARLGEAREHLTRVEEGWKRERDRLLQEEQGILRSLADLEKKRQSILPLLPPQEVALYTSLVASRGTAVARVERGTCRGCGVTLPSSDLQRARSSRDLVRCPSCGRVLYIP